MGASLRQAFDNQTNLAHHSGDLDAVSRAVTRHEKVKQGQDLVGVKLHPKLVLHHTAEVLSGNPPPLTVARGHLAPEELAGR